MDFVAIDFETANEKRASACSCGIAVVSAGQIVETRHWLIRPQELRFSTFNVCIHGINESTVADEPRLCDLWEEIRPYLHGRLVLAHNASFDMSVLRNSLDGYGIPYPQLEYSCTRLIAKETWSDWVCFALPAVAYKLNLPFSHHDAMEDARVCAHIALLAIKQLKTTCFTELEECIGVYRGRMDCDHYCPPWHPRERGQRNGRTSSTIRYKDMKPEVDFIDESNPFFGRKVVFTRTLSCIGRKEAAQLVVNNGGRCVGSVSGKTNIVVVGKLDSRKLAAGEDKTTKLKNAEKLARDGHDIEIISEDDFLRMVSD